MGKKQRIDNIYKSIITINRRISVLNKKKKFLFWQIHHIEG